MKVKTGNELLEWMNAWTYDIECYKNYLLFDFHEATTDKNVAFESLSGLKRFIQNKTLISYNGIRYDDVMFSFMLSKDGATRQDAKDLSDQLITSGLSSWEIKKALTIPNLEKDNNILGIDLINLVPDGKGLKTIAARLGYSHLQELPIDPSKKLTKEEMVIIKNYCFNDNKATKHVLKAVMFDIEMRLELGRRYDLGLTLISKKPAQVAEAVVLKAYCDETDDTLNSIKSRIVTDKVYRYKCPQYIKDKVTSKELIEAIAYFEATEYPIDQDTNKIIIDMPVITLYGKHHATGVGGLHSRDSSCMWDSDSLAQIDAGAYYPALAIANNLYPRHLTPTFTKVYKILIDLRFKAKKEKDYLLDQALKLVLNSLFGKSGDEFSRIFDPSYLIHTTITGQLLLLLLVEMAHLRGIDTISTNTDGIVVEYYDDIDSLNELVAEFEELTNITWDVDHIEILMGRDISSYQCLYKDGSEKQIGSLRRTTGIRHNPKANICNEAIWQHKVNGTPMIDTIKECKDLQQFIVLVNATTGVDYDGVFAGKAVRWYYSTERSRDQIMTRCGTGNKVPDSDGGKLCMDFPDEFPTDIDLDRYVEMAQGMYDKITIKGDIQMNVKAQELRDIGFSPATPEHKGGKVFGGDFSGSSEILTQTGINVGLIKYDGQFYTFTNPSFPRSYKPLIKKYNLEVIYGGVCKINEIKDIHPFPKEFENNLFLSLTKVQQRKILLHNEDAIRASANEIIIEKEYKK